MATTLLNKAKAALRISTAITTFDDEITDLIYAAERDLEETGITLGETDAGVVQAVLTYVKANFGWNNSDADKLRSAYDKQLSKLAVVEDYITPADGED